MLTVQIESDSYVGMLYLGRIQSGQLRVGRYSLGARCRRQQSRRRKSQKIFSRAGLERVEREEAAAGEIVSIAGIKIQAGIGGVNVSLVSPGDDVKPLKTTPIDPPTISVRIYPNDSPVAGKEGSKLTSQVIRERLLREAETNVALRVLPARQPSPWNSVVVVFYILVSLFETLRREGFEFTIGPPKAVMIPDPDNPGQNLEPIEDCVIIVKEEWAGTVIQKLTMRKGEMKNYEPAEPGFMRIEMEVPARGLLGYMAGEFKNDVHGEG